MPPTFRVLFPFVLGFSAVLARGQSVSDQKLLAELPPDIVALLTGQSAWSTTVSAQGGAGYKDNLLLSRYQPEASGFVRGGAEAFLWHVPVGRTDYFAFVNAEETRYFSNAAVDHEAQAFLVAEWRYRIGDTFKLTVDAQGYYLDQIFDVSDTDAQRAVARLQVAGATLGPALHWACLPWAWVEARALGKRESYRDGLNNNRFSEGEARLGWRPGARLEVSLGLIGRRRDFDHREQYSVGGRPQSGTLLRIGEREEELKIGATWDRAAHWKTTTRTGRQHYTDNGAGYFNYRENKFIQELDWSAGDWLVHAEGSAKRLVYEVQTIGFGLSPPARIKESYGVEGRVERKINPRWTIYTEYSWERNRSNYVLTGYRVNEGLLGARWSWEK